MRSLVNAFCLALVCCAIAATALRTSSVASDTSSVNWYDKGKVTVPKNQYVCNASYAFALAANIESAWAIAGHELKNLSAQEIISCSTVGCTENNGGGLGTATTWLLSKNKGNLDTADSVPFTSYHGNVPLCNTQNGVVGASIVGTEVVSGGESGIATHLSTMGPVVAFIDPTGLQNGYAGGVWNNCPSSPNPTHAVLLVGFSSNASGGSGYWVAKNSWGPEWGEEGFFKLPYGSNACGVANSVSSVKTGSGPLPPTPSPIGTRTPAPPVPPPTPRPPGHYTPEPYTHRPRTESPDGRDTRYTVEICKDRYCSDCHEEKYYEGECAWQEGWSFKAWCDHEHFAMERLVDLDVYSEDKCGGRYVKHSGSSDRCIELHSESGSGSVPYSGSVKIRCPYE